MVRLEENKRRTENKAIEKIPLPASVYIPLSQHLGKMCNPEVKMGDPVLAGQRIAGVSAHVWAPIHASISGKVTSIQEWPHPVLGRCKAIVIEGDGEDKSHLVPNTQHKMALGARQIPPRAEHPAQNGTRCEANPSLK